MMSVIVLNRDDCSLATCIEEHHWQLQVTAIVIALIGVLLAIFTFGLSLLFAVILIAIIVLVIIIVCEIILIDCEPEPCPDGLRFTCHNLYELNEAGTLCISRTVTSLINFGMFSEPNAQNNCPSGSLFVGAGCWWRQINEAGTPFEVFTSNDVGTSDDGTTFHKPLCL